MAYARRRADGRPFEVGDEINLVLEEGDVLDGEFECGRCGARSRTVLTVIGSSIHRAFPDGSCGCELVTS